MSSLSALNQVKMEDVFQMQEGYVDGYNNQSFRALIIKVSDIDVYAGEYENGMYQSKAKKLRHFIEVESDENVGRVLLAMLDDREARWKRRIEYSFDDIEDKYEKDACDLRDAATAMVGGNGYSSNEERLNADIAKSKAVLDDLISVCERLCINMTYTQNTKEDIITDYIRDNLKSMGYGQVLDQTRHGISDSGKDAARVDLLLEKDNKEVAIIEALKLDCINSSLIKIHVDKAVTHYNALGTPTFLLVYAGSQDFGDFWSRFLNHMSNYDFVLECKKAVKECVHPNASERVCECILSRDGFDFPVTFLVINVYKRVNQ